MFDVIAQTAGDVMLGGVAGVSGSVIVAMMVKRNINKLLDHVENQDIHIDPQNPPQSRSLCDERSGNINRKLDCIEKKVDKLLSK
jgi:hypothetical protein